MEFVTPEKQDMRRRFMVTVALTGLWIACSFSLGALPARGADWPQFRGPNQNGISSEKGWSTRWPGQGPKQLWKVGVGAGYSSVAVSGGRAYTMGNKGGKDNIYCLDASSGRMIWKQSYKCAGGEYPGPRATPTVSGGRVYTLSREGQLMCLDAGSGRVAWSRNLKRDHKLKLPQWGLAGSPMVEGRLVLLNVGTAGLAVDKATGKTVWQSGSEAAGYATPVVFNMGGRRCAALFTRNAIVGVEPRSGNRMWSYAWQTQLDVNAADPVIIGGQVFITSGYGKGCALLKISSGKAKPVWQNRNMASHFSSSVLVKGYLFGNNDGMLRCLDLKSGAFKWTKGGVGKGGLMAADGKLIVLAERGTLMIAQATPGGYKQLASAQVLGGTCWTPPVLCGGKIYCRNQQGDVVCLGVRG